MKLTLTTLTLSALLGLSLASFAASSKLSAADEAFVKKAAQGGLIEVKLGEVASTKGKRDDVKAFGAKMVTDHSKANDELKALAAQKGVALAEDLDAKHAATLAKISKHEGDAFDGAYVSDMVKDHETDVKEFEQEAGSAQDPDLKAFVVKTLPVLKSHLEHIKGLAGKK